MAIRRTSRLKTKLILLILFPTIIVALTLALYITNAQLDTLQKSFTDRGDAVAKELAAVSIYGIYSGNYDALMLSINSIIERDDVVATPADSDKSMSVGVSSLSCGMMPVSTLSVTSAVRAPPPVSPVPAITLLLSWSAFRPTTV